MPWDCSLKQDVHFPADFYITIANHMVKYKDGRFLEGEFDLSIPNRGAHGYWRILHPYTRGVTSSEGIIQDVDFFLNLY